MDPATKGRDVLLPYERPVPFAGLSFLRTLDAEGLEQMNISLSSGGELSRWLQPPLACLGFRWPKAADNLRIHYGSHDKAQSPLSPLPAVVFQTKERHPGSGVKSLRMNVAFTPRYQLYQADEDPDESVPSWSSEADSGEAVKVKCSFCSL